MRYRSILVRVHPDMDKLIREEMQKCKQRVIEVTGKDYRPTTSQATKIIAKKYRHLRNYEKDSIFL